MDSLIGLILGALALAVGGALLWWLLIASEGVYLGRWVVIWLYDRFAHRYDRVKNYVREYEQVFLAEPLMERLAPVVDPLVLDVATGTGRLPLALVRHPVFQGHVIGVDLSREMLRQAVGNLYPYHERVDFLHGPAEQLPFPDYSFDVVTCLEALEFTSAPEAVLQELVRVLRPGGLILISQRINTRYMPGKIWTAGQIQAILSGMGMEGVQAQIWQVDYRKVWGRKAGSSASIGRKSLAEALAPEAKVRRGEDGIYEMIM